MSILQAGGVVPRRVQLGRAARGARFALALAMLGLTLGGCGNCGGWTNPWSPASKPPHACSSDHASQEMASEALGD
jgi:hypothetical protein